MEGEITIFPNPAKETLTINLKSCNFESVNYSLINATGQIILYSKFNSQEELIDISKLDPGIYFVKITSRNNSPFTKSVIIY